MKKALITGANGFIGSFLTKYLAEKGIETTAFILKGTNCNFLKSIYPSLKNVSIKEGDILDKKSLTKSLSEMNYIIHLAGVIKGYNQRDFDHINVFGTKNLLEACLELNSEVERVILISSSSAAGSGTLEKPLTEDKDPQPLPKDLYGVSKYRMENLASTFMDKLPITIVRPCIVLGPGNLIIRDYYLLNSLGFRLHQLGPYKPVSFIDVEDLVRGIYLCLLKSEAIGEVFYFCSNDIASTSEFQEIITNKIFNRLFSATIPIPIWYSLIRSIAIILEGISKIQKKPAPFFNQAKTSVVFAPGQVISAEKAKRLLDWKPNFSLVDTIIREGNWFIEQGMIKNVRTNNRKK